MHERPRETYKPTRFDRQGPDAINVWRTAAYGIPLGIAFGGLAAWAASLYWHSGRWSLPIGVVVAVIAITGISMLPVWAGDTVGAGVEFLNSGSGTPSEEQFSQEQALVMAGRTPEALELFEARIAAEPDNLRARMRAADLYAQGNRNVARAAELYRAVQQHPAVSSGDDVYVSNRLVDLLLGAINDPGRARVELRRIVVRYPSSRAAEHARRAIHALKEREAERSAGA